MDAILVENDYEKALMVLALREMASNEANKAVAYFKAGAGGLEKGQQALDRSKSATKIADRIDA